MGQSYWRDLAKPIIAKVLSETQGQPVKAIRKALSDAYPFTAKQWHPYKIWLDEIAVQMGTKKAKIKAKREADSVEVDPNQQGLFQ